MPSHCANLVVKEKQDRGNKDSGNMGTQNIMLTFLNIKDEILKKPQLVLSLHYSSFQKAIELIDKNE